MELYCSWTGQKINLAKSMVVFNNATPNWKANRFTRRLGFARFCELQYLGVTLAMRKLRAADFAELLLRVNSTIRGWSNRQLSLAGRATLINSSLLSMAIYVMTHSDIPVATLRMVEARARFFLWKKDASHRGVHYVAWDVVCTPKDYGGLGFHSTLNWRGPLRARLAWDVLRSGASLFRSIFQSRYPHGFGLGPVRCGDSFILRLLMDGMSALQPLLRWRIGEGHTVDVLSDAWIFEVPLARWPTLANYQALEGLSVVELMDEEGNWDGGRLADLFSPDLIDIITHLPRLGRTTVDEPEIGSRFNGHTIMGLAYAAQVSPPTDSFTWLARLKLHPRDRFFWWRLSRGAIPTNKWLQRRGLGSAPDCPWGCGLAETVDHLLG
ncbi:hypothetical protein KSP39_PZI006359 [Platanthera zijinensis]|uniref:Reverse transcriptase zinc-binding domain-containing protein n=1 Tax=Platanthera zijinensis TaxID=2320716 RepID=A0AAP0G9K1_9ASPA